MFPFLNIDSMKAFFRKKIGWAFLLFGISCIGCQKPEAINIDDGQIFCPINWLKHIGLVKPGFANTPFLISKIENGRLDFDAKNSGFDESVFYLLKVDTFNLSILPLNQIRLLNGDFSLKTTVIPVQFDKKMEFSLTAATREPYHFGFGQADSLAEAVIARDSTGFRIEIRGFDQKNVLADSIQSWAKADLQISYLPTGYDYRIVLYENLTDQSAIKTFGGQIAGKSSAPFYAGFRSTRQGFEFAEGKIHLQMEKFEWVENGQSFVDDFDCNTILPF